MLTKNQISIENREDQENRLRQGQKDKFEQIYLYKPSVEQSQFSLPSKVNKQIKFFVQGTHFNTVITIDDDFIFWSPDEETQKKILLKKQKIRKLFYSEDHRQSKMKNPINLLKEVYSIIPFVQKKNKPSKIFQLFSNEEGNCLVGIGEQQLVIILPEIQFIQPIEDNTSSLTTGIEFFQFPNDDNKIFRFIKSTYSGCLYQYTVTINKKDQIQTNDPIMIYKSKNNQKISSFKIIELKRNKLFLIKSKTAIFDFFQNFQERFDNNSREIYQSDGEHNQIYESQKLEDFYQFVFFTGKTIVSFSLSILDQQENLIKQDIQTIENLKIKQNEQIFFHPFLYHYAIYYNNKLTIGSFLFKEILFSSEIKINNNIIVQNKINKHLIIGQNKQLLEFSVKKEKYNSWLYLVNNDQEELAYKTYKGDDETIFKIGKILGHKYFKMQKYEKGILQLHQNNEKFEKIMSLIFQMDQSKKDFAKTMIHYLVQKFNDIVQGKEIQEKNKMNFEQQKNLTIDQTEKSYLEVQIKYAEVEVDHFKTQAIILLMIMIEISSYQYMRQMKLLEIKKNYQDIVLKEEVSIELQNFYKEKLGEFLTGEKYQLFLRKQLINQILQTHNNWEYLEIFDRSQENYFNIIKKSYFMKDYNKCLEYMITFLNSYIKKVETSNKEQIVFFGNILEKFSEQVWQHQPKKFLGLLEIILKRDSWKKFNLEFFHQALNFLRPSLLKFTEKYSEDQKNLIYDYIKDIINVIVNFITYIKKSRGNCEKSMIEKLNSLELYLANLVIYFYVKTNHYDSLNRFILKYDSGVTSRKIFMEFYQYLEMLIQDKPEAKKIMVNIYGIQQNYKKAVELALEFGEEKLAIKWAEKNGLNNKESVSNKKLWLLIAQNYLNQDEDKLIDLLKNNNQCPLKIPDVIEIFKQDNKLEKLKNEIEKHLQDQDQQLKTFKNQLDKLEEITEHINSKVHHLKKKYEIIDLEQKCDVCKEKTFNDIFFYFHCGHHFHKRCLMKKFHEMRLQKKISRIEELENKRNEKFKLPSEKNPVEYAEYIENLKNLLNFKELEEFNKQSLEIENEYASECIYCGKEIIEWAFEIFDDDQELFNLNLNI